MTHQHAKAAVPLKAPPADTGRLHRPYAPWAASWRATLILVGAVTALRILYLAFFCPYALAEDEAHYWEWSRHPAWSYYSKGPGVAWVIAASTRLLGTSEFAVRLPAAVFGAVTALALAGLAREAFRDRRAGFFAAAIFLLTPLGQMSGILMTIDAPYMACWALAAWAGWRALACGSGPAWVALGAAVGAGFLFKYTIVLLLPGLMVFAVWARARRAQSHPADLIGARGAVERPEAGTTRAGGVSPRKSRRGASEPSGRHKDEPCDALSGLDSLSASSPGAHAPGSGCFQPHTAPRWRGAHPAWLAAGILIAALGLVPVLLWNAQHDWATVRHLLGHLGIRGGDMPAGSTDGPAWTPLWMLSLIGSQFGLLGVPSLLIVFAVWESVRRASNPGAPGLEQSLDSRTGDDRGPPIVPSHGPWQGPLFMLGTAAPILVFYLIVSLIAEPEGNWPAAGHLTLIALAGCATVTGMDEFRRRLDAWRADPAHPWRGFFRRRPQMPRQMVWRSALIVGIVFGVAFLRLDLLAHLPWIGRFVPIGRLTSARPLAAGTQQILERLRSEGEDPFVIAQHYGRASQLAFYLPGRPAVYCSSSRLWGRPAQHDYWPETDLDDFPLLRGRAAVMHGATHGDWAPAFERVEPLGTISGDHKKGRPAFVGYGYRGFPAPGAGSEKN